MVPIKIALNYFKKINKIFQSQIKKSKNFYRALKSKVKMLEFFVNSQIDFSKLDIKVCPKSKNENEN